MKPENLKPKKQPGEMEFALSSRWHKKSPVKFFFESEPPNWLISREGARFWERQVLALEIGQTVNTDSNKITRIA
tara:strand:+ start:501 stop:725 length:225 start_codon:yes stop_codon:yes gene_type:complete